MMCRNIASAFVCIATTSACWVFLISQTATSPPKRFPEASDIQTATGPIIKDLQYVDKTKHIVNLIQDGKRYFFVRPRRFGKSVFLATLHRVFNGSKDIFEGTYIYGQYNFSWDRYPVLTLDMGGLVIDNCSLVTRTDQTLLGKIIRETLVNFTVEHGLWYPSDKDGVAHEFKRILEQINTQKGIQTVVLIDEYDFAILNNIVNCPVAAKINTDIVRDLFLVLKHSARHIKFAFVTGISKAVFTTLGSTFDLEDITGNPDFHDIAGLTESDLNQYYGDRIEQASNHFGEPRSNVMKNLSDWYDGYKFHSRPRSSLYNPMSVHSYLKNKEAKGYWSDRGHARFLFSQIVKRRGSFSCLNLKYGLTSSLQGGESLQYTDPALLLYDAGYITIHGFQNGKYFLKFPNKEMEESYYKDMEYAAWVSQNSTEPEVEEITNSLLTKSVPDFHRFMHAISSALEKLIIRAPFKEWYSWQTMLLMDRAEIPNVERETELDISHKKKKIDVTGYNNEIYFLIECKMNALGNSDAWAAVGESIPTFLKENMEKENPMKLLAAGITFSSDTKENVVSAYQAKLISSDGKVSEIYDSEDVPNTATNFYRETNYNPKTFKHNKRSYKKQSSSTTPLTPPGPQQVSSS